MLARLTGLRAALPRPARHYDDERRALTPFVRAAVAGRVRAGPAAARVVCGPRREVAACRLRFGHRTIVTHLPSPEIKSPAEAGPVSFFSCPVLVRALATTKSETGEAKAKQRERARFGIPPLFRTLSIGAKMISEVSDGAKEIHDGV